MITTCPKWNCQAPLEKTLKHSFSNTSVSVQVVHLCCTRCNYEEDDYEVISVPGRQLPHQRDKALARERSRRVATARLKEEVRA